MHIPRIPLQNLVCSSQNLVFRNTLFVVVKTLFSQNLQNLAFVSQATSAGKGAKGSYTAEVVDVFPAKAAGMWPCIVFEKGEFSLQAYLQRRYVIVPQSKTVSCCLLCVHVVWSILTYGCPSLTPRKPNATTTRSGKLSTDQQRGIIREIAECLQALHHLGCVHGDLCPANIMWFNEGHAWKLVDFGSWARSGERVRPDCTLRYASPEVVSSGVDDCSLVAHPSHDMWSLGAIAWYDAV